ncbi:Outer membrane protein assembly factor BamA [Roseobacter fucihabitans]|uniref:Outer membrane protein assembly factor BamA n=1 Tax=Roseobacter fucihabitans TaxID=1537242 RepID=A0ABZ2BTF0_9RHOB|nr:outer membrane protein assembly factor BamA [Roseobacter litoralis]MBC6965749.1 Outer membrane protein assembly factor BamA precursor [Roseobacter litoralis]
MTEGTSSNGSQRLKQFKKLKQSLQLGSVCLVLSAAWIAPATQVLAQQYTLNSVSIDGNVRVGDAAILTRAGIVPGQTLSAAQLNAALQRLNGSGLFESVNFDPQGNSLRITVVEFPTINRISFEGNARIDDEALAAAINSNERRVFNPSEAERDAGLIADAYANEGRLAAKVTPTIIRRSDNRVDLVFEIFEGDNIEIERLSFVGNRNYSDRRLRRVLDTKQAGFLRAFVRSDLLVADRIEFDKQLLRDFYLSRGYVDFRTNSVNAELTEERDAYFLVFDVQEGQQFRFGEITVTSDVPGAESDIYRAIAKIKPGVVYSPSLLEADIARMERQSLRDGVDFLRVEPRVTRDDQNLRLNVEYVLTRGPRIFVERIDVEGNTTTLDQVIRRQFNSVEGDPFNPREIREAAERIRALGYFENAEVNAREGSSPDQVIVDVDVVEAPTGSFSFGASFSNNDGIGFAIRFAEENFLGRGQRLALNVQTTEDSRRYGINFVEPAFLGRELAFGLRLDIAETDSSFTTYDTERFLFQPSLTFPVAENTRLQLRYTLDESEMQARSTPINGPVIGNEIAVGEQLTSSLGYELTYDTRLTGLDPNSGYLLEFGQDFAGLGGDAQFIKTTGRIVGQTKVLSEEVTLRATLEGGALSWSGGTNRAVDRFLLNTNIIRGFEPGGIGPRDLTTGGEDPLGGNLYVAARFEAEFPLGLPEEYGITGGLFYDVGNLWDLSDVNVAGGNIVGEGGSFRHVIGFAILWNTPVGPLRFNFTDALVKEDFDRDQTFELTLSTSF